MSEVKASEVQGHTRHLSHGRAVFLGKHPEHPSEHVVAFRGMDGHVLQFRISAEAMTALVGMHAYPPEETELTSLPESTAEPEPETRVWTVVIKQPAIPAQDTPAHDR